MAESGDTYSNEGDSCAPEGMGDEPDLLERAQKVGHAPYTAAAACYFPAATRRALMLHLLHICLPRVAYVAGTFQEQLLHAAVAHRRRCFVAALNHFAAGHSSGQGPQGPKVRFDTEFSWRDHVARLTDRDFKLR